MKQAAFADEVELLIVSGFRSIGHQAQLLRREAWRRVMTIDDILRVNAAPGFSQHHTGKAIDIASPGSRPLTTEFEGTPAYLWLRSHAADYGFRMPYDRNNRIRFRLRALALGATPRLGQ